ncbi:MAG: hypothetical protein ACHQHP_00750 [Bacteroidia bacterium]
MKRILAIVFFFFCLPAFVFCQFKILAATNQKTFGEMGGITMNYFIELKSKTAMDINVDSIKSIADKSTVKYNFIKNDKGYYVINFSQDLKKPAKCPTCRDVTDQSNDLSKGIIIYYKCGEKRSSFKVKKIKQLPDLKPS